MHINLIKDCKREARGKINKMELLCVSIKQRKMQAHQPKTTAIGYRIAET